MELNMNWLKRITRMSIPTDLWKQCDNCKEILDATRFKEAFHVCPECGHHHAAPPEMWVEMLFEEGSFKEMNSGLSTTDPLNFKDTKKYKDRLRSSQKKTGKKDGLYTGSGLMGSRKVHAAIFDFRFMGGSMGIIVGEKLVRVAEAAIRERTPLIVVSSSGGARMQEGIFSLMQMAKTSAVLKKLSDEGLLYVSILSNPTTGGVTASFAMLGDIHLAEPGALICFAGPRVIKQTIRQSLPEGFQTAEFSKEHGFVDRVVKREDMKKELLNIFSLLLD